MEPAGRTRGRHRSTLGSNQVSQRDHLSRKNSIDGGLPTTLVKMPKKIRLENEVEPDEEEEEEEEDDRFSDDEEEAEETFHLRQCVDFAVSGHPFFFIVKLSDEITF